VEFSCECGNELSGSILGSSWVAAQLVASRVVLSSIELLTYLRNMVYDIKGKLGLRVFANSMLRIILGPKRNEVIDN
jgi:hypothetical protein